MKKSFLISLCFFSIIFIYNQKCFSSPKEFKNFEKYFSFVDTIHFDFNDVIIGEIKSVTVLNGTKFVILDKISNSVVLIDTKENIFTKLSIENEIPGLKMDPLAIKKDPQNGFWVSGASKYYFKFDESGKLKEHHYNNTHSATDKFCIDSKSNIIFYSEIEPELDYFNLKRNAVTRLFKLDYPQNRINIIRRWLGGGILIDKHDNIFIANGIEDKIYKYKINGTLLKIFRSKNINYSQIKDDIQPGKDSVIKFLMKKKGRIDFDTFFNLFFLNKEYDIAAVFVSTGKLYLELFTVNGTLINREKIIIPHRLVYSENNFIYLTFQPEKMDREGNIKNPILLKYKFSWKK